MAERVRISSKDELEAWLRRVAEERGEDEGRRIAVWIAHRAAMRVAPLYLQWVVRSAAARERGLTPLPVLRASLICGVAGTWPTPQIREAADAAAAARAAAAAPAAAPAAAFWAAIEDDAAADPQSFKRSLWPDASPLASVWEDVKEALSGDEWAFWVDWYEAALDGTLYRKENRDLLTRIALIGRDPETGELIGEEEWDKGPKHIAGLIAEIEADHAAAVTPNAEKIFLDEGTGQFRSEPVSELPAPALDYALLKLSNALKIIDVDPVANQMLGLLGKERDLLNDALAATPAHPAALYDTCLRILRRFDAKVNNGDLPKPDLDEDLGDFRSQIDETSLDLLADPEVKALATHRALVRMDRATPEDAASLPDAAEGLGAAMEETLAEEMSSAAEIAIDPSANEEDRRKAIYTYGSLFVHMYKIARAAGKETVLLTGGVAVLFKSVGVIVSNAAAVEKAFKFFLRLFGI